MNNLNRAQRRLLASKAKKEKARKNIEKNPLLQQFIDNFALDISKILVGQYEKMSNEKDIDIENYDLDNDVKEILRQKGEEFGKVLKVLLLQQHKK